ncbi:FeMo cofactor biosynthesis protein NifB [Oxobacter pfennigii]|uniref:FeMo cofactor biosynthesis protein NifB n=1 Tax=Oxobacter pfennigii TaxID=36849 RepID=A0A0P8WD46_9CLOT|nr:FeMo cofactor biosynthesis protein NifB [Oxobacter pfennigii]
MARSFVNLNVNPCKMCMPMGGVMAFKGIENSMTILHGSQGCSTYIRRHMATHYNEPIDIASTSLSEKGTIYGGSENLKKGIKNVVSVYKPEVIGVMTTCLAETIGEDIKRIVAEMYEEQPELKKIKIIPVSTPGYGGTQSEGYYSALRSIVENLAVKTLPNNRVNVIAANLNPGDIREIKRMLEDFSVDYILLPDVSETLDAPFTNEYNHVPKGGCKVSDIRDMGGAAFTIEMGMTVDDSLSPGQYLKDKFGVPLYKCTIPTGLRNTDEFIELLSMLSKKSIPQKYLKERGRLLDAMIDSHKYNGEGRAVVYGDGEQCYAISQLCAENGINPVLIASGAENKSFNHLFNDLSKMLHEEPVILDDTDFETIEKYALELKANIMIGNSDGRRIEEKQGIELIRVGFPIHDRVGGQRKCYTGYTGTMSLIDETANSILSRKERTYREEMYENYYKEDSKQTAEKSINEKTMSHPCYDKSAHDCARMHIPVAPNCNITCNYCSRKYDCPNESRPGVTSEVLSPEEALKKFKAVKKKVPNLTVLGIAGPGDALANYEETRRSIELIKKEDPSITFCLSTNGLMLPFYCQDLIDLGITHVTITINAVDPEIGARLYNRINYLGRTLTGEEGASILLQNQLSGLTYLASKGIVCKVNIVMVKGVNDAHIPEVVKKVKECGAFITNIMQMIPASGSKFENMPLVSQVELNDMRKKCEVDLKQMYHCKQCRADAIGTLSQDRSIEFRCNGCNTDKDTSNKKDDEVLSNVSYRFAIASKSGINIDQHFGHAEEFYIYEFTQGRISFVEKRDIGKYCSGNTECDDKEDKMEVIIDTLKDCNAVLALRAGHGPTEKLGKKGIKILQMYEGINKGIEKAVELMRAC